MWDWSYRIAGSQISSLHMKYYMPDMLLYLHTQHSHESWITCLICCCTYTYSIHMSRELHAWYVAVLIHTAFTWVVNYMPDMLLYLYIQHSHESWITCLICCCTYTYSIHMSHELHAWYVAVLIHTAFTWVVNYMPDMLLYLHIQHSHESWITCLICCCTYTYSIHMSRELHVWYVAVLIYTAFTWVLNYMPDMLLYLYIQHSHESWITCLICCCTYTYSIHMSRELHAWYVAVLIHTAFTWVVNYMPDMLLYLHIQHSHESWITCLICCCTYTYTIHMSRELHAWYLVYLHIQHSHESWITCLICCCIYTYSIHMSRELHAWYVAVLIHTAFTWVVNYMPDMLLYLYIQHSHESWITCLICCCTYTYSITWVVNYMPDMLLYLYIQHHMSRELHAWYVAVLIHTASHESWITCLICCCTYTYSIHMSRELHAWYVAVLIHTAFTWVVNYMPDMLLYLYIQHSHESWITCLICCCTYTYSITWVVNYMPDMLLYLYIQHHMSRELHAWYVAVLIHTASHESWITCLICCCTYTYSITWVMNYLLSGETCCQWIWYTLHCVSSFPNEDWRGLVNESWWFQPQKSMWPIQSMKKPWDILLRIYWCLYQCFPTGINCVEYVHSL